VGERPGRAGRHSAPTSTVTACCLRRRFLRGSLGAALVALGAAFVFPLRSLGPRPRDSQLDATPWHDGVRLVTEAGRPVRAADVPADGLVTVFPAGAPSSESGQAVLVRVEPGLIEPLPGREDWSPQGLIAYSKVCTHAGCPVGLYEATSHQLLMSVPSVDVRRARRRAARVRPRRETVAAAAARDRRAGLPLRHGWLQRSTRARVLGP